MKRFFLFFGLVSLTALLAAFFLCLWLNAMAGRTEVPRYTYLDTLSLTDGE